MAIGKKVKLKVRVQKNLKIKLFLKVNGRIVKLLVVVVPLIFVKKK